ncbi:MAG: hypothetical protein HXY48_13085 [Ignavibacteriaceae bacterium]|nr:hypothetical protein [Ignavibacteriaceae bacterium]
MKTKLSSLILLLFLFTTNSFSQSIETIPTCGISQEEEIIDLSQRGGLHITA